MAPALPNGAMGSGPVSSAPHFQVIILPLDASIDPAVTASAAGSGLSASPVDLRRTVNLGDVASLRPAGVPRPVFFNVDGHTPGPDIGSGSNAPSDFAGPVASPQVSAPNDYFVSLPADPRMELEGNFDPADSSVTVQIPVSPSTQSIRVVLRGPLGLPDGSTVVLGQIALIDPNGSTLAQFDPVTGSPSPFPQDLTVAMQNAPAGGQLVVRLTSVPGTGNAAGPQSPSTSQSNVPFVLDVQTQNQSSENLPAATAVEPGWVGSFAITYAPQAGQSPQSPSASSASIGDSSGNAPATDQTTEIPPAGTPVNDGSADGEGYYVRMATGPLVSRSAGPLGPVLAAAGTDLTPPVDRHERALLQEIPMLDQERESDSLIHSICEGRWAVAQIDEESVASEPGERHVAVVLGAGGFPMKVTSRASRDRTGLAELLAALPAAVESPSSPESLPGTLAAIPELPVELLAPVAYRADRREYAGYLKAACGLVLGLSLTSGPFLSDVITSLRKRTSRWRPVARG
jgi:hypothetical protein